MAKFYTNLGDGFNANVKDVEGEIEKRYAEVLSAVEVSKQNILQKLRKISEMEDASKTLKNPGEALKLGFDKSILEHIHTCASIQLSKEFRKSVSIDTEVEPEPVFPGVGSKNSLEIPLETKRSYSPLESDSTQSLAPILPTQHKKNFYPTTVALSQGNSDANLNKALGLAVHPITLDIYIADAGSTAIKVFNSEGEFKFKFGSEGCNPYGIAIHKECIYLTNWGTSFKSSLSPSQTGDNFQIYNSDGKLVKKLELSLLSKPRGLTVDAEGNAYVCSTAIHKVVFITTETQASRIFAAKYTFREPRDVTIHNGRIVVLDDDNPSLHFFTPQDVHQQSIVANFLQIVTPFAYAYIYDPAFFAMASDGTIYVTDRQRHFVKIYSPEGKYVTRIGKECDVTTGCFRDPEGIAIGTDGRIYTVCNRKSKMLQVF